MSPIELLFLAAAGGAAGFVNAVAGGGTLISFPALTAIGVPIVSANVTSTIALTPGYVGGAYAQRDSVRRQWNRLRILAPAGALGGLLGGVLLLTTSDDLLRLLIPYLILLSCALLAGQDKVSDLVEARRARRQASEKGARERADHGLSAAAIITVFLASIYGGYFGAGLGIVFLAVLGVFLPDDLTDVNALKQALAVVVNLTAAAFFVFSGRVWWAAALVMAIGAVLGGNLGGRVAGRLDPLVFRWIVVAIGVGIAIVYLVR